MITRAEALELLKKHVKQDSMIKHSLASEAVMRSIARKLNKDEELWGITGLLHDIDVELTHADPKHHALMAADLLKGTLCDEAIDAIVMHNEEATGKQRTTVFQHALSAGETITGLITATTLVYPDKKLSSVKVKSITKRMKEAKFAASVKRENILECEKAGIPLPEFAGLALEAMCKISYELGL